MAPSIGITTPGVVTDQVMQAEGVQYDLRKFHWIGSPADEVNVLWVWHTTPVKTLADVRDREVRAAARPGTVRRIISFHAFSIS